MLGLTRALLIFWTLEMAMATESAGLTPEEECSSTDSQLRLYGYESKAYNILTDDGYILSLFRIVTRSDSKKKEPMMFVHGVLSSSDCFLANGSYNPPFYFVEHGYDVWLANVRGSQYGQKHLMYDYTDPRFWNFTFEEIGTHDLKANIDFILANTRSERLHYYGISQGATALFAAFALDPSYFQQRLQTIALFSPVVRLDLTTHPIILYGSRLNLLPYVLQYNIVDLNHFDAVDCAFKKRLCQSLPSLCQILLFLTGDADPTVNRNIGFSSEATSVHLLHHFTQIVLNRGFYRYQRAADQPLEEYDLGKVTGVPVALFVGGNDYVATVQSVDVLKDIMIRNQALKFYKVYPSGGHNSFLILKNGAEFLNDALSFYRSYPIIS